MKLDIHLSLYNNYLLISVSLPLFETFLWSSEAQIAYHFLSSFHFILNPLSLSPADSWHIHLSLQKL